jgi:ribonuclease PH
MERGPRVASIAANTSNNSPIVSMPKRTIISEIAEIIDDGSTNGGDLEAALAQLLDLFIKVTDFVGTVLVV